MTTPPPCGHRQTAYGDLSIFDSFSLSINLKVNQKKPGLAEILLRLPQFREKYIVYQYIGPIYQVL